MTHFLQWLAANKPPEKAEPEETVEDFCRRLLSAAIADDLVAQIVPVESLSSGDLVGMANLLVEWLAESREYKPEAQDAIAIVRKHLAESEQQPDFEVREKWLADAIIAELAQKE